MKTPERRQKLLGLSSYTPETSLLRAAKIFSKTLRELAWKTWALDKYFSMI